MRLDYTIYALMFVFVWLQMDRLFILLDKSSIKFSQLLPSLSWYSEPSSCEQLYRWYVMCYFTIDNSLKQIIHRSFYPLQFVLCIDNATARFLQHTSMYAAYSLWKQITVCQLITVYYNAIRCRRLLGLKCSSFKGIMWNLVSIDFLAHIDEN